MARGETLDAGPFDGVPAGIEIGTYRPGDESSICSLFEKVFRQKKSPAQWRWQFVESGSRPHVSVARDRDGRVVAHFGCIPRRARVGGHEWVFAQSVDSMVDPDCRRGLRKPGLFTAVVRNYVERFGRVESEALGYGLPNRAAYRIGQRFLGYTRLRDVTLFAKEIGRGGERRHASSIEVCDSRFAEPDHDELWKRVESRLDVAIVRDRAYSRWRYERCPSVQYRFVCARRAGELEAVATFRDSYLEPGCGTLVDILWSGVERDTLAAVVLRIDELARAAGLRHVVTMLPTHAPELPVLDDLGYRPIVSGLSLVARSYHEPLRLELVSDRWWYTFGDFDLA